MGKRDEVLNYISDRASYIREAAVRNNEMWEKGDFDEAVDYLVWWMDKRFDLFDELYGGEENGIFGRAVGSIMYYNIYYE